MSIENQTACTPVHPVAAYIGGKRRLSATITARIEKVPHETYCEPFAGMGGVFFRRRFKPSCEVINDISGDVVTLYRVLQHHYVAFMDVLRFQVTSREQFGLLVKTDPDTLTDLHRAARFLYLQRLAFGGKVTGRNFGVSPGTPGRFDVTKLASVLEAVSERLAGVIIEKLPWQEILRRYDRPGTLFYLDPPYFKNETDYGAGVFEPADFDRLADALSRLQGRFILSLNDHPEVRKIFAAFAIEAVPTTYSISRTGNTAAGEVLISSPEPRPGH